MMSCVLLCFVIFRCVLLCCVMRYYMLSCCGVLYYVLVCDIVFRDGGVGCRDVLVTYTVDLKKHIECPCVCVLCIIHVFLYDLQHM